MKNWDKNDVARLILKSAEIALEHFDSPVREYKRDRSIVTQADKEIEAFISETCENPAEGSYVIGEETVETKSEIYLKKALEEKAWIIDPIDGTFSYAYRFPMWGVSIGYAERGKILEGALYLPIGGELLVSEGDRVYFARVLKGNDDPGAELEPLPQAVEPLGTDGIVSLAQNLAKTGEFKARNYVHSTGSCVFSLVHLLLGGYISYIADLKLWDLAGGIPLYEKLGCPVRFDDGRPFGSAITEEFYRMGADDGGRWKTRGKLIFARDEESLAYTAAGFGKQPAGK